MFSYIKVFSTYSLPSYSHNITSIGNWFPFNSYRCGVKWNTYFYINKYGSVLIVFFLKRKLKRFTNYYIVINPYLKCFQFKDNNVLMLYHVSGFQFKYIFFTINLILIFKSKWFLKCCYLLKISKTENIAQCVKLLFGH